MVPVAHAAPRRRARGPHPSPTFRGGTDGKGKKVEASADPADVQIFYSRSGQSADAIIERLASKYAKQFELMVATSDSLEAETVHACGAESISPDGLRELLANMRRA